MAENNTKKIWDLPTRLFHWLIVISIAYAYYCVEFSDNMDHHFYAGYVTLALILFRIFWGIFGSTYARFSAFFFPPKETLDYATKLFNKDSEPHAGHNPLGSLSALLLMLLIAVQATTGLFASDGYFLFAPLADMVSSSLSDTLTEIHQININILLGFIALHIAAVLFYQFYKRQHIVPPMITGRKKGLNENVAEIKGDKLLIALPLILLSAGFVYWISQLGGF